MAVQLAVQVGHVGGALAGLVAQAEGGAEQGPGFLVTFAPFLVVFAVFYFLIIRPQNKQQREQDDMRAKLKKGDDVVLQGGVLAKVYAVGEKDLQLEIAPKVVVRALRSSIAQVVPAGGTPAPEPEKKA